MEKSNWVPKPGDLVKAARSESNITAGKYYTVTEIFPEGKKHRTEKWIRFTNDAGRPDGWMLKCFVPATKAAEVLFKKV